MKIFASVCVTLILGMISTEIEGVFWPYSRGRLSTVTPAFLDHKGPAFHKVPTSHFDPLFKDYEEVPIDICYPVKLYCFPNDPSYCLFTDYLGTVVGVQIGWLAEYADQVPPEVYDYRNNTNFILTRTCNQNIYAVRIWFTNPEKLTESGRSDVSEVIEGLWAFIDGKLERFDQRCQVVGPSIGGFDLQGCVPLKGTLYVYNFNKYSCCRTGFFLFVVYDRNSLVGFGHATIGNFPAGPSRDWFDRPKGAKLRQIAPAAPSCFPKLLEYGLTSSVTFLIEDPYNIKCPGCSC